MGVVIVRSAGVGVGVVIVRSTVVVRCAGGAGQCTMYTPSQNMWRCAFVLAISILIEPMEPTTNTPH